jgi:hypothetical protein
LMIRTQISVSEEQMRRLRAEARRRNVAIAEFVRDAIDRSIPADPGERRARRQGPTPAWTSLTRVRE